MCLLLKCNLAEFTSEWENVNGTDSFEHCDVEAMWTVFSQKYDECVMKHVPKSRPKKGCKPKPLWMTSETLLHIKRKRHAWNKYLATRRTEDFEQYKRVRNITNEYVKTTKWDYEKNISQKIKTEPKQFWRYVKSKTKSVDGVFNLKNEDGTFTKSDKEKAELLNGFFSTVFTKENLETLPEVTEKEVLEDLQDIHVSETEVLCTSHLQPRPPRGRGIAGILTFLFPKPGYMPSTAGILLWSKPCESPRSNPGR